MHRDFTGINGRHFDVLVCGGGIYGAWTAYDAALRGLKVALADQGDWANATSSASSKLIHGGLRYLELLDFKLVRKTLAERQMLLQTAAHRVWPLGFGIPVYKGSRIGRVKVAVGLAIYDWLARSVPNRLKFHRYSAGEFAERFPFLNADGLLAGFSYFDAQTDDARLVLELIDGAQASGAVCVNYCKVTGFREKGGKLTGAGIRDQVTGEEGVVYASQIVNATGQWSGALYPENANYRLSKGVHLILPRTVSEEALLLTAKSDGRVFFMIPWYGRTLVGTTDDDYSGDIDRVSVEHGDIRYLLTEVNRIVDGVNWGVADVIGAFAGLRVLKQGGKGAPSSVSRDWELKVSGNGLLSSIGGKLTSARADAESIVDRMCANLGVKKSGRTFGKPFPWMPEGNFDEWTARQLAKASALGIDSDSAHWLLRRHGGRVDKIFLLCEHQPGLAKSIQPGLPFILADLVFCARNEMAVHLDDVLRRRLPLLILARLADSDLRKLAGIVASELHWDQEKMNQEYLVCKQRWLGRVFGK